jgi:hypothetical protein
LEPEGQMLIRVRRRLSIIFFKGLEFVFTLLRIKFSSPLDLYAQLWGKNKFTDMVLSDPNFKGMLDSMLHRFPENAQLLESLPRITVVIPVHQKDYEMLQLVLDGISINSLNPIEEILIITPSLDRPNVASQIPLRYLTDSEVLNSSFLAEAVPDMGSGWIKQQVIKICAVLNHVSTIHNVILDSDTVICAPRLFATNKFQELSLSKEYHVPYMTHVARFDSALKDNGLSYVTHFQVWQKNIVRELWGESKLIHWLNLRDKSTISGISEYQTYGRYVAAYYRDSIRITRWGNFEISRMQVMKSGKMEITGEIFSRNNVLSVSIHSYS